MSKAARMGVDSVSAYAIAVDPVRGTAFATNSLDGTVTILKAAPALANTVVNMTDLWWNPADSGWGVFLEHQGTTLFATLFLRAADGSPRWYVMSGGVRNGDGSFSGALYRTTGPLATSIATIAAVGTMRITPHDLDSATLLYDIDGATHSSPLSRLVFTAKRSCGWTAGGVNKAAGEANFTALWYDAAQPGWGISLSHRGDTIFGVLFSYDAQNRAVWWSMSNGARQADGSFAGTLYRISGSGLLTVGTMALSFTSAGSGVMTYEADGERVTRPIGRNVFAALVSDCGGPI